MNKTLLVLVLLFGSACLHARGSTVTDMGDFNGMKVEPGLTFDLVGQVMFVCDDHPRRITLISEAQPRSMCFWDMSTNSPSYGNGDLVRVRGVVSRRIGSYERQVPGARTLCVSNISVVGHAPMPRTLATTAPDIESFLTSNEFVHVDGVLVSAVRDSTNAEWNWLVLRTESGSVRAAATERDYPLTNLVALLDADVRLQGIVHTATTRMRIHRRHVILFGTEGLVVRRPPPDPFAAPDLADEPLAHRQQVSGRVLGIGRGRVFVRKDDRELVVALLQDPAHPPALGDRVILSGFAELEPMGVRLNNAVCRIEPAPRPEPDVPAVTDAERMFTTPYGQALIDTSLYGKVLRIRGRIANSTEGIRADGRILLECGQRTVTGDVGHLLDTLDPEVVRGCLVDLSGVCLFEFDTETGETAFPRFKGFVLYPRTAADIAIVSRPPWWTPVRLLTVIVILLVAIVVIAVWNRMLQVLSERRGRELYREQLTSAKADLKVEERTRLAVELHDSISQTLTGVALQIDAARGSGKANPAAAARFLETARAMLASCRQELRCCIWDLKSRTFDAADMTEAVQKTLAPHLGTARAQVRFNVPRKLLSESSAHDTLRIIRELALNAIRHGKATALRIAGECREGTVRFSVADDGCGFDPATAAGPAQGHFGLQGIRERIRGRNGTLELKSRPGKGTKATVTFKAEERENDEP